MFLLGMTTWVILLNPVLWGNSDRLSSVSGTIQSFCQCVSPRLLQQLQEKPQLVASSETTSQPLEATPIEPIECPATLPQPASQKKLHLSSEQRRQAAEQYYLTLRLIFQQALVRGKPKKVAPGSWTYQDKEYAFTYNESKNLFTIAHIERGVLARYKSGKLNALGQIEAEDIETFAKYSESQKQPLPSKPAQSKPQRSSSQLEPD